MEIRCAAPLMASPSLVVTRPSLASPSSLSFAAHAPFAAGRLSGTRRVSPAPRRRFRYLCMPPLPTILPSSPPPQRSRAAAASGMEIRCATPLMASPSLAVTRPSLASPSSLSFAARAPFAAGRLSGARRVSPAPCRRFRCLCLFGLGVPELVVIAGVAALVFGPKLPEIGHSIGKTVKSFQEAAKEFKTELERDPGEATKSSTENLKLKEIERLKHQVQRTPHEIMHKEMKTKAPQLQSTSWRKEPHTNEGNTQENHDKTTFSAFDHYMGAMD